MNNYKKPIMDSSCVLLHKAVVEKVYLTIVQRWFM